MRACEVVQPMKRSRLDIFGFRRWPSFPGLSGRVTPPPAAPLCCAPPLLSSPSSSSSSWLRTHAGVNASINSVSPAARPCALGCAIQRGRTC